jgi:hypothetical protein
MAVDYFLKVEDIPGESLEAVWDTKKNPKA